MIFVYRQKSALPFQRYFTTHNPLEFLNIQENANNSSVKDVITGKSEVHFIKISPSLII